MTLSWGKENGDGREDVVIVENGTTMLTITQEFYRSYNYTYEQMQNPKYVAEFLASWGLALALKLKDVK